MADAHHTHTDDELGLELWVVLARAYDAIRDQAEADVRRHGLTPAEFAVLELLYHKGPTLLCDVQRRILVSSGGITYLVDRLAKKGLVERRECTEDRRARYAALTPRGSALIRRIFPEHARVVGRAVSGLNEKEAKTAARLLRKLGRRAAGLEGEGLLG